MDEQIRRAPPERKLLLQYRAGQVNLKEFMSELSVLKDYSFVSLTKYALDRYPDILWAAVKGGHFWPYSVRGQLDKNPLAWACWMYEANRSNPPPLWKESVDCRAELWMHRVGITGNSGVRDPVPSEALQPLDTLQALANTILLGQALRLDQSVESEGPARPGSFRSNNLERSKPGEPPGEL